MTFKSFLSVKANKVLCARTSSYGFLSINKNRENIQLLRSKLQTSCECQPDQGTIAT